jgi:hypothetical protein
MECLKMRHAFYLPTFGWVILGTIYVGKHPMYGAFGAMGRCGRWDKKKVNHWKIQQPVIENPLGER